MTKTAIVTTLGELIRRFACVQVRPLNLEHFQAHCAYVHHACYQAVADDDVHCYSPQAEETFPFVEDIADQREKKLTEWGDSFWIWFISLSESDRTELKKEVVNISDPEHFELLTIG